MPEQPDEPDAGGQPASDYGYDLAHEATGQPAERDDRPHEPISVATETSDSGGDYGYDLAHDVPASPER